MNEFDSILDSEAGLSAKSFRTASGFCRVYPDRIELVKKIDDTLNFFSSPSFIIRIALFLLLSGILFYQQFTRGSISMGYSVFYAVPSAIVLISIVGNLNAFFYRIRSVLFILLLIWFIFLEYSRGNESTAIVYFIFILILSYSLYHSFDYTYTPVIDRKDILHVKYISSIPVLTRAYFVLSLKKTDRKEGKQLILMPGIMDGGEAEKRYAFQIMKEENLIS